MVPLIIGVAYYTYMERKVIGFMQIRKGPNRVGFFGFKFWGLGQPIADGMKLALNVGAMLLAIDVVDFFIVPAIE